LNLNNRPDNRRDPFLFLFLITAQDLLVLHNCFTNSIGIWQSKATADKDSKVGFKSAGRPNHSCFQDTLGQQNVNLKNPSSEMKQSCQQCSVFVNKLLQPFDWIEATTCFLNGNEMKMMMFSRPSPSQ
jgi:hypothetical protein